MSPVHALDAPPLSYPLLIVEPHLDTNDALQELFEDCGAERRALRSIEEAVSWLSEGHVPCAMVVSCGPMDVEELKKLLGILRRQPATFDVPVFVATTVPQLRPLDDRMTVVQKPFSAEQLHALVQVAAVRCR